MKRKFDPLEEALRYEFGRGVKRNYKKADKYFARAIKELTARAKYGDAEAAYLLGECYIMEWGVELDYQKSFEYYLQAAKAGHALAQYETAICYQSGCGVEQNPEAAIKWYLLSAEQGVADAQNAVAICYENGDGVSPDNAKAVLWYKKAAEQNSDIAIYNLGCIYLQNKEYNEAFACFERAVEIADSGIKKYLPNYAGFISAINNLAYCYEMGYGVKADLKKAFSLYHRIAGRDAVGTFNLAECYELGKGVEKNIEFAKKWYKKAATLGDGEAKAKFEALTK